MVNKRKGKGRKRKLARRKASVKRQGVTLKNKCTAMVLVDSAQVRKKYISQCKRARTTYQKARQELDVYEQQDKPAFDRWIHAQLGAELTAIRELRERHREKNSLCNRIILESHLSGSSMHESYKRIKNGETEMKDKFHENFEDDDLEDDDVEDPFAYFDEDPFDDDEFYEDFRDFEEEFKRFFFGWRDGQDEARTAKEKAPARRRQQGAKKRKLKAVYREVCRRLHPDAEGGATNEELEIWHQVQEAYQQEDLERLEFLRAKTDIAQNGISHSTPVSHVQMMTEEYKQARASLRKLIRKARQDEAWGFARWSKDKADSVLKKYWRHLKQDKTAIKEELEEMEDFLEGLEDLARAEEEADAEFNRQLHDFRESRTGSRGRGAQKVSGERKGFHYDPDQIEFDFGGC